VERALSDEFFLELFFDLVKFWADDKNTIRVTGIVVVIVLMIINHG